MPRHFSRLSWIAWLALAAGSTGCYNSKTVVAPTDILLLTASPTSIPADGFSTSKIVAHVDTATSRTFKFSFSTSGGTLSTPNQTLTPDSNGDIVVLLTSDATPKTALVSVSASDSTNVAASGTVSVPFDPVTSSNVIRLTASANQLVADGASSIQLRAQANPALANHAITFKTTAGSFDQATPTKTQLDNQATDSTGVAIVQLYAPTVPGTGVVSASVASGSGGFSDVQTVTFTPALPDFIAVQAAPLAVSNASETNTTTITATLSRAIGKVTQNTRVAFSVANDANGQSFGRFQNVSGSNGDGQATAQFVPGTTAPLGLATVTVTVPGTSLSATVKINITM